MKISQDIRREHGGSRAEIEQGTAEKSKEFAAVGNRVYLPIADHAGVSGSFDGEDGPALRRELP
ncbi:hypothetical protein EDD92_4769 [Streptomyces sp. TLI_185]|nr:hypothetical protein [Streptomyces sp. TLI_185]RPF34789.1 hypothetical protein EDD92_4769 [Streptomyces sp. TLI_185]